MYDRVVLVVVLWFTEAELGTDEGVGGSVDSGYLYGRVLISAHRLSVV